MKHRIGIVGVSGYGGGEVLRLAATHPQFEVVYVAGESSAGAKLGEKFPGLEASLGSLQIQKWDPGSLPKLDVLFASLPSGESRDALAKVPADVKVIDIGGDHRYVEGWTYGLADVLPDEIRRSTRIANPGCYPAATLVAIAPLLEAGLVEPKTPVIVDAKSGVSGAGRGGGSTFGYAEVNESTSAYGLLKHAHVPEIGSTIARLGGTPSPLVFTPHLVPMTRGILATIYLTGAASTDDCFAAARKRYAGRPFVRVIDKSPQTKWAAGSNLVFVHYAADPVRKLIIAIAAIDNLGKGAAGQAVQNANLMLGLEETSGLASVPLWP
jgi:N-acetyl-gamma-glutamyl-phosphate reductase